MKGRPLKGDDHPVGDRLDRVLVASMKGRPIKGGDLASYPRTKVGICVPR